MQKQFKKAENIEKAKGCLVEREDGRTLDNADQHPTKSFIGLQSVYGPSPNTLTQVCASDGTLLTDKGHIIEGWTTYFNQLLNRSSDIYQIYEQALSNMP
jgi:hypothetical protein